MINIEDDTIYDNIKVKPRREKIRDDLKPNIRRSCKRKVRFKSYNDVKNALRKYPNQRAYECEWCGGWHCTKAEFK